jgi:phosphatidylglycerophosphatase C
MARLALFDFDGTITNSDTLFLFTASAVSPSTYWLGLSVLTPVLVLHKLGVISAQRTKEIFLSWYFKGVSAQEFNAHGSAFAGSIDRIVRPKAMDKIREHQESGDRIVIVSASAENWIRDWAAKNGLELLATRLEVVDSRITGKIAGQNCNANEKVNRINAYLNLKDYESVVVYGDSKGDREMMALGSESHFMPFRN